MRSSISENKFLDSIKHLGTTLGRTPKFEECSKIPGFYAYYRRFKSLKTILDRAGLLNEIKRCIFCGNSFSRRDFSICHFNRAKFCSAKCRKKAEIASENKKKRDKEYYLMNREKIIKRVREYELRNKKPLESRICLLCKTRFQPKIAFQIFCSDKCAKEYSRTVRHPEISKAKAKKGWEKRKLAENERRKILGLPLIGEGYAAETEMKLVLDTIFYNKEKIDNGYWVVRDGILITKAGRLGGRQLDRYYPKLKLAFEYRGEQHYSRRSYYYQGEPRFIKTQQWDKETEDMCERTGVCLVILSWKDRLWRDNILKKIIERGFDVTLEMLEPRAVKWKRPESKEVIGLYLNGTRTHDIAKKYGVRASLIRKILKMSGVRLRSRSEDSKLMWKKEGFRELYSKRTIGIPSPKRQIYKEEDIKKIIFLYNQGHSTLQISKITGYTPMSVLTVLRLNGVKIRTRSEAAKLRYSKNR